MSRVSIHWDGQSRDVWAENGTLLLELLRREALPVAAPCGGNGKCGKCQVLLAADGAARMVPACRTRLTEDCQIWIPEGAPAAVEEDADCPETAQIPREGYGAAVDLGTTTVAVRLFSLSDGRVLGTERAWNSQMAFGADVISRAQYTMEHPGGLKRLSGLIRRQISGLLRGLCRSGGIEISQVRELSLAGNTIMQHIFMEISPAGIATAPYTPETLFDAEQPVSVPELPGVALYLAPCVSGYVGGDITAGLLAASLYQQPGRSLFLDVGTNGEMALGGADGFLCCSVACGPAFEGAEIRCGMLSGPGAVQHVTAEQGKLRLEVVGGGKPLGLCGSGLIDLLAVLLKAGVVDETGRLLPPEEAPEEMRCFLAEDENGNGIFYLTEDCSIFLTAGDVRKLQLAKAAVAAGIDVLLKTAEMSPSEVPALYLAGGFGGGLRPESAADIGMIPRELAGRIVSLGNSSLAGAGQTILNPERRKTWLDIQKSCRYLELSGNPAFTEAFVEEMLFEAKEETSWNCIFR